MKEKAGLYGILKTFYDNILRKPLFWIPVLVCWSVSFMPSFTMSKLQFEDFHREHYFGSGKGCLGGRWGLLLWDRVISFLEVNDVLEKYVGGGMLLCAAILTVCIFYSIKMEQENHVLKYTALACGFLSFPLVNEIWSYTGANFAVCGNLLLDAAAILVILHMKALYRHSAWIAALLLMIVASSYESGLFAFVTLVCALIYYRFVNEHISVGECIKCGFLFAVPLAGSIVLREIVGSILCAIYKIPRVNQGDVKLHWGNSTWKAFLIDMFDHYVMRGLVYLPITVFVICSVVFVILTIYYSIRNKKYLLNVVGIAVGVSLFLQPVIQGSYMPYRTAQTLNVFVGFVLFLFLEFLENKKTIWLMTGNIAVLFLCYRQSAFFSRINLLDQNIAKNDYTLVHDIGFKLTTEYYGKPVLFVGRDYIADDIYSDYLLDQVCVKGDSFTDLLYDKFRQRYYGSSIIGKKYVETNLYSTLFLLNVEPENMESYFSSLGYDIQVLYNYNVQNDYPDVYQLLKRDKLHKLEFVDMGDYVVVSL